MPFVELQSVDSTNNYALARIYAGLAQHGACFFAHEQVAGKGQRGKSWEAERSSSLIMSVTINPSPLELSQQFHLSAAVALAVSNFFKKYAGDPVRIKWPNDLYWYDRKAGGILIENVVSSRQSAVNSQQLTADSPPSAICHPPSNWPWAVIGIGININQGNFPSALKNPVSLKQITGKEHEPLALAKELCGVLDQYLKQLGNQGFKSIYQPYLDQLYKKGQSVRFKKQNRIFEAIVKSVSPNGDLIVQHAMEEELKHGEAEWIL